MLPCPVLREAAIRLGLLPSPPGRDLVLRLGVDPLDPVLLHVAQQMIGVLLHKFTEL